MCISQNFIIVINNIGILSFLFFSLRQQQDLGRISNRHFKSCSLNNHQYCHLPGSIYAKKKKSFHGNSRWFCHAFNLSNPRGGRLKQNLQLWQLYLYWWFPVQRGTCSNGGKWWFTYISNARSTLKYHFLKSTTLLYQKWSKTYIRTQIRKSFEKKIDIRKKKEKIHSLEWNWLVFPTWATAISVHLD